MAKYELADSKQKDDVKRLQSKAFHKKVFEYTQQDTQYFTTLAAHNLFQSHLALVGCSNRDLLVLDINYNKRIVYLKSPHLKPLNSCTFFVGPSQKKYAANIDMDSYNLFITQAADGWAKMWDLRSMKIIREFKDHTNRVHSIHGDVSPCLRYFASGSQDRAMYLYDVRQGQLIEKTKNADHGDCVMDAKFSPLLNEIATVSLDGQFRVFGRVKKLERLGGVKKGVGGGGGGGRGMKEGRIKLNELRDPEAQREVREQIRQLEYE